MEPTSDVLFFLRSMASANRFEKMMAILSTVDTLDDLDMDTVVESYVEDMRSYVEDSSCCKEYLDMIHHALGESKLFTYLMEADFSHNLDAGDTVEEFTSFKYLDYNRLMNETCKRIHSRGQVNPLLF